jgi:hypothetical protein
MSKTWADIILSQSSAAEIWQAIMDHLLEKAKIISSPAMFHAETVTPDRLLSEMAWELWNAFPSCAKKTSDNLIEWTDDTVSGGKAVLVLDALSLRELFVIKESASERKINITNLSVTASECPSSTGEFAKALGLSGRSVLANDGKSSSFKPFNANCYTDVCQIAFEDCSIPTVKNLFIWHSWLDDLIHQSSTPDMLEKKVSQILQSDGFWSFINNLRQGRRLLITSDHGYAIGRNFSSQIDDARATEVLRKHFGAKRYNTTLPAETINTIPPVTMTHNNQVVVIGQNKWKVPGGYPNICHGGMSLLESLVPWIELEAA